jgi:hypothetical protein
MSSEMWLANAERALYDYTVTLAFFMIEVEQLLKPVSVEEPCGKNEAAFRQDRSELVKNLQPSL